MNSAQFEPPNGEPPRIAGETSDAKRTVLAFSRHFLPGYRAGGPIRTLINMIDRLEDDVAFWVVTQDRDLGDSVPYANLEPESWNIVRKARVHYLPSPAVTLRALLALVREVAPDAIYLNSFFDPLFTQRILLLKALGRLEGVTVILAPRGELSPGALQIKRIKKRAYLLFARLLRLHRGVVWHASSEHEKEDIRRALPSVPESMIKVALNLAPLAHASGEPARIRERYEPLRVCFLSRISPMKNLDYALSCLHSVKAKICFTIYGPREDAKHWESCEQIITALPKNVIVSYAGEITHQQVRGVLAQQDLFFLPTRGENYGHVIHEALAAGLPVLLSDTTPWGGVVARGVGWELPLDQKAAYARVIDEVAAWTPEELAVARRRAAAYAAECTEDAAVLMANRQLFIGGQLARTGVD